MPYENAEADNLIRFKRGLDKIHEEQFQQEAGSMTVRSIISNLGLPRPKNTGSCGREVQRRDVAGSGLLKYSFPFHALYHWVRWNCAKHGISCVLTILIVYCFTLFIRSFE